MKSAGREPKNSKCLSCGIKFLDPLPSKEQVDNLYNEKYFSGDGELGYENYLHEEKVHRMNFQELLKKLPVGKNFLDIGCAYGLMMDEAKKVGWWVTDGVEPHEQARKYIFDNISRDAKVFKSVDEIDKNDIKYDACTLLGVLEHLTDPKRMMSDVYSITQSGGYVLAVTNNYDSMMPLRWRGIEHPMAFSRKSLSSLMQETGFKVEFCDIHKKWYSLKDILDRISLYIGVSLKPLHFLSKIKPIIKITNNEAICLARKIPR